MRSNNLLVSLKGLAILLVLTFALVAYLPGFASAAEPATVTVAAPGQAVGPGEQFTISINVEPNNAIAGMQFDLNFDPSIVTADNVEEGDLLTQDGASSYFSTGEIDNEAGAITVVFGAIISPGQTVSTTGTFAIITLTAGTEGGTCPLTLSNVVIGDIEGQSVPVSVTNGTISVNRPPVLNPVGNKTVNEGGLLTFTISASDPDGDGLTYSASNLPQGATFDPNTQTFSWTPGYDQSGTYVNIYFEVSDGELTDSENITITVNGVNEPYDISNDGAVNVLDIIVVTQQWGATGSNGWISEDINVDGAISVLDIILIGQHWTA